MLHIGNVKYIIAIFVLFAFFCSESSAESKGHHYLSIVSLPNNRHSIIGLGPDDGNILNQRFPKMHFYESGDQLPQLISGTEMNSLNALTESGYRIYNYNRLQSTGPIWILEKELTS